MIASPFSARLRQPGAAIKAITNPSTASTPLLPQFLPLCTHRTLFGFGRKDRSNPIPSNPVLEEYLKRKPQGPPKIESGDLASSSIFEQEEGSPTTTNAKKKATRHDGRDPDTMAAALDPMPVRRKRWDRKMVIHEIRGRGRLSKTALIKRNERDSLSKSHWFKTSVKKLAPLARQIQGKPIEEAITQMRFSTKKAAKDVREHLIHARNEAIVRKGMGLGEVEDRKGQPVEIELKDGKRHHVTDRTAMYVDQAWVNRGPYGRSMMHRARGRIDLLRLPYTGISVLLKEEATRVRLSEEIEKKRDNRKLWVQLPNRPIPSQRQYYSW